MLLPVAAALALWVLESGRWLVVYNDGPATLAAISLAAGDEPWTLHELAPRESRRLRVRGSAAAEVVVEVADWSPAPPGRVRLDEAGAAVTTLRLDAFGGVTVTSTPSLLQRCLEW